MISPRHLGCHLRTEWRRFNGQDSLTVPAERWSGGRGAHFSVLTLPPFFPLHDYYPHPTFFDLSPFSHGPLCCSMRGIFVKSRDGLSSGFSLSTLLGILFFPSFFSFAPRFTLASHELVLALSVLTLFFIFLDKPSPCRSFHR